MEVVHSIESLVGDVRFWAAVVAVTHEVSDPAPVEAAFGVVLDEAWDWFERSAGVYDELFDEPLPLPDSDFEYPIARVEIPLADGVRLRLDAHAEGFTVILADATSEAALGEFSGHHRLPLLRPAEAFRLAEVAEDPGVGVRWRPSMTTALVIGGTWDGQPTGEVVEAVRKMWEQTGLVSPAGAAGLSDLWRQRASAAGTAWLPAAQGVWVAADDYCTRGDTMAIDAHRAGLDNEVQVGTRTVDRLLRRALGWKP